VIQEKRCSMSCSSCRTILAGLAGGLALNLVMLLTFRLLGLGWNGGGILLDPSLQSPKVIAVWTQLEPIPLVVTNPMLIGMGLILFGVFHAFVYQWLAPAWPPGIMERAGRLAVLVFGLSFLFWEFFTPFNQLGEPLPLIGLELIFWAIIALAETFVIAAILETGVAAGKES
jgi:hypothetical protein